MYWSLWLLVEVMLIGISNVSDAILNSEPAVSGQFPHVVYIVAFRNSTNYSCTGGILDETHILTAAHCVFPDDVNNIHVIVNELSVNWNDRKGLKVVVRKCIHPKYTTSTHLSAMAYYMSCLLPFTASPKEKEKSKHDIAVIKLQEPLVLGTNPKKFQLPDNNLLPYGETLRFAGFGLQGNFIDTTTSQLKWMEIKIFTRSECLKRNTWHRENSEFCAQDPNGIALPNSGDSGGPLIHNNVVLGVLARGPCLNPRPHTFVNVFAHLDFIREALRS